MAISIPCYKTATSRDLAKLYIYHVYRYFGPPQTITSDRGPQFISEFWQCFCSILGTRRQLSTAYHRQTDGQTEIYIQYLTKRLRPFINYYQDDWSDFLPLMDYAQLTLPHDSLGGLSPFEVVHGYAARTSFDWKPQLPDAPSLSATVNRQEAAALTKNIHQAWSLARSHLQQAQSKASKSVNAHRRPVDFQVGQKVWLDMRQFDTSRPSRKLDYPTAGPFEILEKVNHSYRLKLPSSMKVHNVFSPDKLRLAAEDPLPGQISPEPPPINITGDNEYEVEEILAAKLLRKNLYYRVSWLNCDIDLAWYPASDFKYAPHKLVAFHNARPDLPGPPAQLLQWVQLYDQGVEDYDDLDSDRVMDKKARAHFYKTGG